MKRAYTALALLAGIAVAGSAFSLNGSSSTTGINWSPQSQEVHRSVIKVHTDTGVVTLPGRADTWDATESAQFVAEGLANLQLVNNQASVWPLSNQ